jgi:HD-GYP domain-containing protein (c-di-GMP phosphodiesterase class II)
MPGFSEKMDQLRSQLSRELESAAGSPNRALTGGESERAMLQAMPDPVFHISRTGAISVLGSPGAPGQGPAARRRPAGAAAREPARKATAWDPVEDLAAELGRQGKDIVARAVETGQVQTLEIEVRHGDQTACFEVRAGVYNRTEAVAVARDFTARRDKERSLTMFKKDLEAVIRDQSSELNRLQDAFRKQVALLEQEEEVLKKSFTKAERLLEDTIGAITIIAQKKDPYTAGHQQKVSQLACAIGREMGLSGEQIRVIRIASLLHDVGMLFVPAEYLAKPGKLSDAEFSMIKAHPDMDYQILKTIDFSFDIADIVHQHHERLDGSGYPKGLKGDAILLESRIIAVADVVEAMVSRRPHRPAPGVEAAIKELEKGRGTLYDPDAVDTCIKLFREQDFTFKAQG